MRERVKERESESLRKERVKHQKSKRSEGDEKDKERRWKKECMKREGHKLKK